MTCQYKIFPILLLLILSIVNFNYAQLTNKSHFQNTAMVVIDNDFINKDERMLKSIQKSFYRTNCQDSIPFLYDILTQSPIEKILDSNCCFCWPFTYNDFWRNHTGIFYNIKQDYVLITGILENSPGHLAGVLPGMKIVKIDNLQINQKSFREIDKKFNNINKDSVLLSILDSSGKMNNVKITPEDLSANIISGPIQITKSAVYLKIRIFNQKTIELEYDFKTIETLKDSKIIIIDLRNNNGGILEATEKFCELFLKKHSTMFSLERNSCIGNKTYVTAFNGELKDNALIILVNENTENGAEIVASCLKDRGNSIIVGTRTKGQGPVNETFLINDTTQLRVYTGYLINAKGQKIDKVGVFPDVFVKNSDPLGKKQKFSDFKIDSLVDKQLYQAISLSKYYGYYW